MKMTHSDFSLFLRNLGIWVDERNSTKNRDRYNSARNALYDILVGGPHDLLVAEPAQPVEKPLEAGNAAAYFMPPKPGETRELPGIRRYDGTAIKIINLDFATFEVRALLAFAQQFPNCHHLRKAQGEALSPGAWCKECAKIGYCKGKSFAF